MTSYALAPQPRLDARTLPTPDWDGFRSAFQTFARVPGETDGATSRAPARAAVRPITAPSITDVPSWPVAAGAAAILSVKIGMLWLTFLPA